jgi:hypothetical protein
MASMDLTTSFCVSFGACPQTAILGWTPRASAASAILMQADAPIPLLPPLTRALIDAVLLIGFIGCRCLNQDIRNKANIRKQFVLCNRIDNVTQFHYVFLVFFYPVQAATAAIFQPSKTEALYGLGQSPDP